MATHIDFTPVVIDRQYFPEHDTARSSQYLRLRLGVTHGILQQILFDLLTILQEKINREFRIRFAGRQSQQDFTQTLAVVSEGDLQVVSVAVTEEVALVLAAEVVPVLIRAVDRKVCGADLLLWESERQQGFPDLLQRPSGMFHRQFIGILDVLQLKRNSDRIRWSAGEPFAFDSHS